MGPLKKKTSSANNYHRNRMYQQRPSSRQATRVNTPNKAVPGLVGPHSRMKQLEGTAVPVAKYLCRHVMLCELIYEIERKHPRLTKPNLPQMFSESRIIAHTTLADLIEELKTAIDKTKAELKEIVSQKNEEIAVTKAEAEAQLLSAFVG